MRQVLPVEFDLDVELQEEVRGLRQMVERLAEAESFNRQLGAGEKRDQTLR